MPPTPIVIRNRYALGDTVCLSAAIRDLHLAHPGRFRTALAGNYRSYWQAAPYVHPIDPRARAPVIDATYKEGAEASHRGKFAGHFLTWFHRSLGQRLGVAIPVTEPKGVIHLPPKHDRRLVPHRYWVVAAGGKTDMTAKWWSFARYQAVVDALAARGIACVQAGANFAIHVHARLDNCTSMVGRTDDIADLFALVKHADGVICGITSFMHIAAAYDRPCVVIAGGREEPTWEAYTNHGQFPAGCAPVKVPHVFLHTVGLMPCCKAVGCWKARVVPIEAADTSVARRGQLCSDVVRADPRQPVPRCLDLIEPDHVLEAVMSYYQSGVIPPIVPRAPVAAPEPPATVAVHKAPPAEVPVPARPPAEPAALAALDHAAIGGKLTVFILCYGDHADLARRCHDSIAKTLPAHRRDVRVALNQPCAATVAYFDGLVRAGLVTKVYPDSGDRRKYPAMRAMFRDPDCPIRTPYLAWFDDDAKAVDPLWAAKLAAAIAANHGARARLYGAPFSHDLAPYARNGHRPDAWFRAAPWWRGVPLRHRDGRPAANGSVIRFVSGWFWALATEMILKADIPDARLNHNGGDICISEQVHQAGYEIKAFNHAPAKGAVWCPPRDQGGRRGYQDPCFPWAAPAVV